MMSPEEIIVKSDNKRPSRLSTGLRTLIPAGKYSRALVLLGITTVATHSVFTREFLNVFAGNEFVVGAALFSWAAMLGLGVWLGTLAFTRFIKNDPMAWGFILLAISPVIVLLLAHFGLPFISGNPGITEFWKMTAFTLLVQAPVAVLCGLLFSHFVGASEGDDNQDAVLKGLAWMGTGSLAGGLIVLLLLQLRLVNAQIILVISLMNLAFGWTLVFGRKKILLNALAFLLNIAFLALLIPTDFQGVLNRRDFSPPSGILMKETCHGQLSFAKSGQVWKVSSGTSAYYPVRDSLSVQESVHFTMLQHYKPQTVLLISGAASGYAEEILKYSPEQLDIMELNPSVLLPYKEFSYTKPLAGVKSIKEDPATYLQHCLSLYDVVLIVLPNPSTIQINRYYTLEFFKSLREKMNDDAYVYVELDKNTELSNAQMDELNSMVFYAMKKVFRRTILIPGRANHLIATERDISIRLAGKAMDKGIQNGVIAGDPVSDSLLRKDIEASMGRLTTDIKLNRDYHPGAFFAVIRAGMPSMNMTTYIVTILLSLLAALFLYKGKGRKVTVFATGFTMLSLTVLLLFSLQAMFGSLYLLNGIMLSLLFLGIAIGIKLFHYLEQRDSIPAIPAIQVAVGSFAFIVLFFLLGIREVTHSLPVIYGLYFLLMLTAGTLTGLQLPAVIRKESPDSTEKQHGFYLALLLGCALGALLATVFFFPLVGLILTCIVLGVVNAALGFIFY